MKLAIYIDTLFDTVMQLSVRCSSFFFRKIFSEFLKDEDVFIEPVILSKYTSPQISEMSHTILKNEQHTDAVMLHDATYYASAIQVPIYENPTIEYDTQIGKIPYGESILIHEARGRFFRVTWNELSGWILREHCVDRASLVYPNFQIGEEYGIDHPHTAHVRAIIKDEFGVAQSEFPLQAGEYVLYKLWRKGIRIEWPQIGHRVPGLWHTLLKGCNGIHMGVMPKTGTVMEYMLNTDVGHLAYVEAVFPDGTISISEVNFPDSGIYNERTLTKDAWKMCTPVFIQIV